MGRILVLQTEGTLSRTVASNAQAENERLNALSQELREVSLSTVPRCTFCRWFVGSKKVGDKKGKSGLSEKLQQTVSYFYVIPI